MMKERVVEPQYDADWRQGYYVGLEAPGDIPQALPCGFSAFNVGYIAGMKAARSIWEHANLWGSLRHQCD